MRATTACVYVDSFNRPSGDILSRLSEAAARAGIALSPAPCCQSELPELGPAISGSDIVIVLGGDGAILRGLDAFRDTGIPVAGINAGHLGYLASAELSEMEDALARLASGSFRIEQLPALKAALPGGRSVSAVNDICINRAVTVGMLHLVLGTDSEVIARIAGDGLVVSTPLGSTAYALSAGGPVLDPELPAILVVPLCPHQLSLRPMVFPARMSLRITTGPVRGDGPWVVADGRPVVQLEEGQSMEISLGQGNCSLVRFNGADFYSKLGRKLGWSTRGQNAQ